MYGLIFEDNFTTAKREKYNPMCSIEAHEKNHKSVKNQKPVNDETSSGGDRPLPYHSTEEELK